jgi:sugar phosphate isomerase/epimerase
LKFGIVADEIDRDFARAVAVGKQLGILRYEIRGLKSGRVPVCSPDEIREVERIADGEGVEITAISPGLFKLTDDAAAFANAMSEVYPLAAELAHRWKIPGLIVFGFHKPGATEENASKLPRADVPEHVIEWLAAAGARASRDGLTLMIEPEPICWAHTAATTVEMIRRSGASSLRINYDPGNVAWFEQRDPIGEFQTAAPWIANVHVKDLLATRPGEARPEFVPAGEGLIDYRRHFAGLKKVGYAGPISLEPHMDGSLETIRRCKEALEKCYETDAA